MRLRSVSVTNLQASSASPSRPTVVEASSANLVQAEHVDNLRKSPWASAAHVVVPKLSLPAQFQARCSKLGAAQTRACAWCPLRLQAKTTLRGSVAF